MSEYGYAHGLVLGKFYPPHLGHSALIREAAEQCHLLTVLVEAATVESIALEDRVAWLRAEHADDTTITVLGARCDVPLDLLDEQVWVAQVAVMRAALQLADRPPVDAVFSSESYGDELAARFDTRHVCFDAARARVPISSTAVRADLPGSWDLLAPTTRAGLATRIVAVGAESTGTTTLARLLADHYRRRGGVWERTAWVPEHGRHYTMELMQRSRAEALAVGRPAPGMDELVWRPDDFARIAARQSAMEDAAAAAGSPLLICDTDAFATSVWERRYLGAGSRASAESAGPGLPRHDLYLLTSHEGVPFEQDGIRDGEAIRADMTGWFVEALTAASHPWVLLTGTLEQRLQLAIRAVDATLDRRMRFAPPPG